MNQKNLNEDEMFELFDEKSFSRVKSFIDKYGIDSVDRDGRDLLLNLTVKKKTVFLIKLINEILDLNLNQQDKKGWAALRFAVQENNLKIVEALLKKGAEVDIEEENGNTPLWRGLFNGVDEKIIIT